ncbi:MAG TPA: hypothetical protein VER96_30940 [Polyangiaceae bacterium]|nr:hypothetical protein [Polyangiaceae bacterium]
MNFAVKGSDKLAAFLQGLTEEKAEHTRHSIGGCAETGSRI